jgi:Ras GTPase-activating protein 3
VAFLLRAVRDEVRDTSDPATIFRGNSVASKALDAYQKILCVNLLRRALGPLVAEVFAGARGGKKDTLFFELDATRPDGADTNKNLAALEDFAARAWRAVQAAKSQIPDALRVVYAVIRENVASHFGSGAEGVDVVRYTAPSGFLFLRFFCPAILNPMSYGVADGHAPSETASRNLTLLSKTLMSLGNLVEFGQKEPFMMGMNAFIRRELPAMRSFLDDVCAMPPAVAGDAAAQDAVPRTFAELLAADRCAARITVLITELLPKMEGGAPAHLQEEVARLQEIGARALASRG